MRRWHRKHSADHGSLRKNNRGRPDLSRAWPVQRAWSGVTDLRIQPASAKRTCRAAGPGFVRAPPHIQPRQPHGTSARQTGVVTSFGSIIPLFCCVPAGSTRVATHSVIPSSGSLSSCRQVVPRKDDCEGKENRASLVFAKDIETNAKRGMAERVGFEPTIRFHVYTLSRRAPSTARPSLRGADSSRCAIAAAAAGMRLRCSTRQPAKSSSTEGALRTRGP